MFTFTAYPCWGYATLEPSGHVRPLPVRLADVREFPVRLDQGRPVVDWTGLIQSKAPKGFKAISFTMPEDGYVSLNIKDNSGQPVRQLLNNNFYTKGHHEVRWDGLTTMNWRTPGQPVPAGEYRWEAIWHKGIGLRLVGWACNPGTAPWDSDPTSNWGGDHGQPAACVTDGQENLLGWSAAEAGKALLACDLDGNVLWKNSRSGMGGAELVAVDSGIVYVQDWGGRLYRLEAATGRYVAWAGTDTSDLMLKTLWGGDAKKPESRQRDRCEGRPPVSGLYPGRCRPGSRQQERKAHQAAPHRHADRREGRGREAVRRLRGEGGAGRQSCDGREAAPFIGNLRNARAIAFDAEGRLYVGLREPDNQVLIFDAEGKPAGKPLGRPGGRRLLGRWTPDGMAFIASLTVDAQGKLWVAEGDMMPKRFSCWDIQSGKLVKEFLGPTTYARWAGRSTRKTPT